jgi:hypothetical protein
MSASEHAIARRAFSRRKSQIIVCSWHTGWHGASRHNPVPGTAAIPDLVSFPRCSPEFRKKNRGL